MGDSMSDYQIPWDDERGPVRDPRYWPYNNERRMHLTWRDNFTFEATLELQYISWDQASNVRWRDIRTGTEYNMFITDFEKMLLNGKSVYNKTVSGKWTFIKRGKSYGLRDAEAPR